VHGRATNEVQRQVSGFSSASPIAPIAHGMGILFVVFYRVCGSRKFREIFGAKMERRESSLSLAERCCALFLVRRLAAGKGKRGTIYYFAKRSVNLAG
jgi:hypothetical protein